MAPATRRRRRTGMEDVLASVIVCGVPAVLLAVVHPHRHAPREEDSLPRCARWMFVWILVECLASAVMVALPGGDRF